MIQNERLTAGTLLSHFFDVGASKVFNGLSQFEESLLKRSSLSKVRPVDPHKQSPHGHTPCEPL